jgi:hypothetical protein
MKLTRLFIRESTDVIHVIHPLFVLTTGVYPLLVLTLREVVAIKVLMRDNGRLIFSLESLPLPIKSVDKYDALKGIVINDPVFRNKVVSF